MNSASSSFASIPSRRIRARALSSTALNVLLASALFYLASGEKIHAQGLISAPSQTEITADNPFLLKAANLKYDFDRDVISAVGSVQVYYDQYSLEAERIDYNRADGTMTANGNVRMIEPDGNVITAQSLELSDDFKNGFAGALQVDTPQRTHFLAEKATREGGNKTTFENGLYTVYSKPTATPSKPPLWRVKAAKIVHNQEERVIYYEDASFEFFGQPIAYFPYLSMPDPTVKRKSGFLIPSAVYSSRLGVGVKVPYYFALSPHTDLLVQGTALSNQGFLPQAEWRQRTANGQYSIFAGGLIQARPSEFDGSSGDRRFRGVVGSEASFDINERWKWGWNVSYRSDRAFLQDYDFTKFGSAGDVSKLFLTGENDRNRFDLNAYAFRVSQEDYDSSSDGHDPIGAFTPVGSDLQDKQPYVHPVLDYQYFLDNPIAGGEVSFLANFTSLTRDTTDAFAVNGVNRYRGVEGTFTRASAKAEWRRTLIDSFGQTFTPFFYARGDVFFLASADKNVTTLTGDAVVGRLMPAAGLEYSYPIIATFKDTSHIIEPIAQVIVRPDEQGIGTLPNEDAQSIVFDATTLFEYDKFSGFDRSEGGTRANIGLKYKMQINDGGYMSALFGRSYHLAGQNSYSKPDLIDATGDSGLETNASDYVGSLYLDSAMGVRVGAQARFDENDFSVRRAQVQASGVYGPVVGSIAYAFLGQQPDIGIDSPREEVIGATSLRIQENWRLFGSIRYDLENDAFVQDALGIGYDDEGFSMSFTYSEDRSRNNGEDVDRTFFLRLGFRTLGDTQISSNAN